MMTKSRFANCLIQFQYNLDGRVKYISVNNAIVRVRVTTRVYCMHSKCWKTSNCRTTTCTGSKAQHNTCRNSEICYLSIRYFALELTLRDQSLIGHFEFDARTFYCVMRTVLRVRCIQNTKVNPISDISLSKAITFRKLDLEPNVGHGLSISL